MKRHIATGLALVVWLIALAGGGCGGSVFSLDDAGGGGNDASSGGSGDSSGGSSGAGSSSGNGSSSGGLPDGGGCRQAADCRGPLPTFCQFCPDGSNGCAHWECRGGVCEIAFCATGGTQDGGSVRCGPNVCPAGERCCDHCTGSCVNALSGANCPDDNSPMHPCADAGCALSGSSCASTTCCAGLSCCSGIPIPPGQAYCYVGCPRSDFNVKAGFASVQPDSVLDAVAALPLSKWHYKEEPPDVQHIGPMAQDFKAAFGVGADDKHIFQIDADGVSLAAIQALAHRLDALTASQRSLERENADLLVKVRRLERRVSVAPTSNGRPDVLAR
jgi:Chaperone of endosialidase